MGGEDTRNNAPEKSFVKGFLCCFFYEGAEQRIRNTHESTAINANTPIKFTGDMYLHTGGNEQGPS